MGSHWSSKGRGVSGLRDFSASCPGDSSHLWKNWEKEEPGERSQTLAIVTLLLSLDGERVKIRASAGAEGLVEKMDQSNSSQT